MKRVLVCEAQVPFVRGGAEIHVRSLARELRTRGYETEIVAVPFTDHPKDEILAHAAAWRLLNLTVVGGRPVDLVIATKFPTYFVRHPRKVTWLLHQHRAAYELVGTPFSDFDDVDDDVGLRLRIAELDRDMLGESRAVFANSRNTASRLLRFNGVVAEPLYHPPTLAGRLAAGPYGDYVLCVSRLEAVKRVDLAIRAIAQVPAPLRLVVAGDGTQRAALAALADSLGVTDRVVLLGGVDEERLVDLYAQAAAVLFAPYDEDYGYVTLEAFLSRRPVITATDSGGTLEFVIDGRTGLVCEPAPEALADAMARLAGDRGLAARLGDAGFLAASAITWDHVIERLTSQIH